MDTNPVLQKLDEIQRVATSKLAEHSARLLAIEQMATRPTGGGEGFGEKSLGQTIVESEGFQALQKGAQSSGRIALKSLAAPELKIVSGTWSAPPDYRPIVAYPPQIPLPVRALMPNLPTSSSLVEFPTEVTFTNNASYQIAEGDAKGQSDATYSLTQLPVCTIAHWIPASRQLLDDSAAFSNYVNARMIFMLEKVVEQEILFGSGLTGHMKGIVTSASGATETATGLVDSVGGSISQLAALGVQPDAVVCNPQDWWTARMSKASTSGNYLIGDPLQAQRPTMWGLTVALAPSMTAGRYLVGNFAQGAAIYDRQQNVVEISREHSDYFIRNLAAILVETRLCVATFSPLSFVYGAVGPGS